MTQKNKHFTVPLWHVAEHRLVYLNVLKSGDIPPKLVQNVPEDEQADRLDDIARFINERILAQVPEAPAPTTTPDTTPAPTTTPDTTPAPDTTSSATPAAVYERGDNFSAAKASLATAATIGVAEFGLGAPLLASTQLGGLGMVGVAGLYGMGRLHGKIWNSPKGGFIKNVLRGAVSPVTLPAAGIRLLARSTKKAWQNNWEAIPKMLKGKSSAVKAVSSPVWWPIRSGWRMGKGIGEGFSANGINNTKGIGKITYPIGKVLKFLKKNLWDYPMSPAKSR